MLSSCARVSTRALRYASGVTSWVQASTRYDDSFLFFVLIFCFVFSFFVSVSVSVSVLFVGLFVCLYCYVFYVTYGYFRLLLLGTQKMILDCYEPPNLECA